MLVLSFYKMAGIVLAQAGLKQNPQLNKLITTELLKAINCFNNHRFQIIAYQQTYIFWIPAGFFLKLYLVFCSSSGSCTHLTHLKLKKASLFLHFLCNLGTCDLCSDHAMLLGMISFLLFYLCTEGKPWKSQSYHRQTPQTYHNTVMNFIINRSSNVRY